MIPRRAAEGIKYRVEQLLAGKVTRQPLDADTAHWVANLEPLLAAKLARVDLINSPIESGDVNLGEHLAAYFARRTDVKPSTMTHWRQAESGLLEFFGADRVL